MLNNVENILLISMMINKHLYPPSLKCIRNIEEWIDLRGLSANMVAACNPTSGSRSGIYIISSKRIALLLASFFSRAKHSITLSHWLLPFLKCFSIELAMSVNPEINPSLRFVYVFFLVRLTACLYCSRSRMCITHCFLFFWI